MVLLSRYGVRMYVLRVRNFLVFVQGNRSL